MTMRILLLCLLGLLMTACGNDSDSSKVAAPSGLSQSGLDISDINADAPPVNGQLPDELVPPGE